MTIRNIIERVAAQRPAVLAERDAIRALSELDNHIYEDIVLRHEGAQPRAFPYAEDTRQLIAPARFSKLYEAYLRAEAALQLDEPERYAYELQLFQAAYDSFRAWYNETHMPLQPAHIQAAPHYVRRG
ncbi:MAG: hypothetical protein IJJ41_10110 [Clostridia bacterium]|nr:hypothetical protein [Clostridia bacterium]